MVRSKSAMFLFCSTLFLLVFVGTGFGERILSVAFWSTKSHKLTYDPLLEALAARGHNVTVLSPIPSKKTIPNLKEILTIDLDHFMSNARKQMPDIYETKARNQILNPLPFIKQVHNLCDLSFDLPHVKALQNEKFDVILMPMLFNECAAAYAHGFNTSTILISPISVDGQISSIFGNPTPPSFVPNAFTGYSDQMTFFERTKNFVSEIFSRTIYHYFHVHALEYLHREKFHDPNFPTVHELLKKSSLILSNSHFALSKIRPFLPDIVEVGGMHCLPAKPLPTDLAEFVKNSGSDGFILFSMGSSLQGSMIPETKRLQILRAFSKLKQNVLWKWETETMPDLPSNVKLSKWLPQQDILGQSNIKAFITHGGFGSTTEAACHGVPLIGVPMFADQSLNMEAAENSGLAIKLDFNDITEATLTETLNKVIYERRYRESARAVSKILLDQPNKPIDRAVFWTEYVLRHKGAPHLRSSARDLNFFQYHSIDVITVIILIVSLTLWLIYAILRTCLRRIYQLVMFFGSRSKDKKYSRSSGQKLKQKDE